MLMRIQKIISASGLCSRRQAEELIRAGRVEVNGAKASIGDSADPDKDSISVDGRPLPENVEMVYIMLNKPRGYVTTLSDEKGRKTVAGLVVDVGQRLYPVGRLDMDSEGLLIMTNDGDVANRLMHPSCGARKTYQVKVRGGDFIATEAAEKIRGITWLDGERVSPAAVSVIRQDEPGQALLEVTLSQGKNRQVRRLCAAAGLDVLRLKRVSQGGLSLGKLKTGQWRYLSEDEIRLIRGK